MFFFTFSVLLERVGGGGGELLHTLFCLQLFRLSFVWSFHLLKRHPTVTSHFIQTPVVPAEFCLSFHLLKYHSHPSMTSHFMLTPVISAEFCLGFHLLMCHPTVTSHFMLTPVVPAEFCLGFHQLKHHGHPTMTSHSILILLFQRSSISVSYTHLTLPTMAVV